VTTGTAATNPVLVTGATGFLGSHLIPLLREGAASVRVLARGPAPELTAAGVEVVPGDVVTGAGLGEALEGVRRVFHLAGRVSRDPDAAAALQRVHVNGARTLAEAARRAGVERILLVSTSGTIAVSRDPEPECDEAAPVPIERIGRWPYYRSKWLQERALLADAGDMEIVIVNPSLLLGPGDERLSSTGDVLRFLSGQVSVIPPGGLNFVDVRDAAAGCVAAMAKGRSGQRYLLGGHNWSFADFFARLGEVSGAPVPRLRLPRGLYTVGALLTEEVAHQVGREPAVDRISREMAACYWYFSSEKAIRELGHEPRDGRVTLLETVQWFRGRDLA
jgi:dihydroflavonol-4-reductase